MRMSNISRYIYKTTLKQFNIVKRKMDITNMYYHYFMNSIMSMFTFKNLPDSIPEDDLKFIIFKNGYATLGKANDGKLYAFGDEGLGGEPNPYYNPTISVVANPSLNFTKTFVIGEDCTVVKCTSLYNGFDEIISLYSSLLATIDISMYWVFIGTRQQKLFEGSNQDVINSLNEVFNSLEDGDKLKAITGKPLFNFLKTQDYSQASTTTSNIKALIEAKQYLKSSFFMMLGINANYNMKRESLNENEIDADIFTLIPHIDDVFNTITKDLEDTNKMFGTTISVEYASSWDKIQNEVENRELEEDIQIEALKNQVDDNPEDTNIEDPKDDVSDDNPEDTKNDDKSKDGDTDDTKN